MAVFACSVQCLSDGDCGNNDFCFFGACVAKADIGVPCVSVRSAYQPPILSCTSLPTQMSVKSGDYICARHGKMFQNSAPPCVEC